MQVDEETRVLLSWGMKILGYGASFIGGVVTATWIVATKVKGYETSQRDLDLRLSTVEGFQKECPGKAMAGIDRQIAALPDRIEQKMEKKFERVHERIDEILLHGKGGGL